MLGNKENLRLYAHCLNEEYIFYQQGNIGAMYVESLLIFFQPTGELTHTERYSLIYIYIYIYLYEFWIKSIIQAGSIKFY